MRWISQPFAKMADKVIEVAAPSNPYLTLLSEFPSLTQVCSPDTKINHEITHHIETTGPPVSAHRRRLALNHLRAAKHKFEHKLHLGIIRPSFSAWSSPLHMVPKKTAGDWRPCGDYRALNRSAVPNHYLVPYTSLSPYKVPLSSLLDLVHAHTTKFQSPLKTYPKQLSQLHLVYLSMCECLLV